MVLGKPKKQTELLKDLQKQNLFSPKPQDAIGEEAKGDQPSQFAANPLLENVIVEIEERVNCSVNKDGEVDKF